MRDAAQTDDMTRLLDIIAALRGPDGCPWDREQTLESLKPYLIEEAYELLDVAAEADADRHRDELGDVLLQLLLQSRIREEQGAFSFHDVVRTLTRKMIRRHPHVFGDATVQSADAVVRQWEQIKAGERETGSGQRSVIDGIPRHMPSLMKAQRTQGRASRAGFDWNRTEDVLDKIEEELNEVREAIASDRPEQVREEIGDLLFSVVNLARFQKTHAEAALDAAVGKFARRFRAVEDRMHAQGRTLTACTLAELDAVWDAVKADEQNQEGA